MHLRQLLGTQIFRPRISLKIRRYSNRNILKLQKRGMYEDIFPNDSNDKIAALLKSTQCVYAGFDPTADSLHVGNLLILMNLLHWQRGGHQVIAVLGGATGLIGDPSHRKNEREEMEEFVLQDNMKSIRKNIETIFCNHETYFWSKDNLKLKPLIVLNNIDFYNNINVIQFARNIGKYFRLGTMLGRASVQARLNSETGMSFTEFTYQIFQAYDWLHLAKTYNCLFQIGGSDQMGNIMSGYDLITKSTNKTVFGMTLPLITAEGGKKFGKSIGNAVWLTPSRSSSFQLYQFFIRTKDSDVQKFLKYFTFLPLDEIHSIIQDHFESPGERKAQRILAEEVTRLVHGEDGLIAAKHASTVLYSKSVEPLLKMSVEDIAEIFEGAAVVDIFVDPAITAFELAMKAKCFKTEHDADRIIEAGGFYINHMRIINRNESIVPGIHILSNNVSLLRVGKKTYYIVRWIR